MEVIGQGNGQRHQQQTKARDAAHYCPMHGTIPTTKNDPAPNVNSAEVGKP